MFLKVKYFVSIPQRVYFSARKFHSSTYSKSRMRSDRLSMAFHFLIHSEMGYICRQVSVSQTMIYVGRSILPTYPRRTNACSPESQILSSPLTVFHLRILSVASRSQVFFPGIGKNLVRKFLSHEMSASSYRGLVHQSPQSITCPPWSRLLRSLMRCSLSVMP